MPNFVLKFTVIVMQYHTHNSACKIFQSAGKKKKRRRFLFLVTLEGSKKV